MKIIKTISKIFIVSGLFLLAWQPLNVFSGEKNSIVGQWIWCQRDKTLYQESITQLPALLPGIWVSTIGFSKGQVIQQVAFPPNYVEKVKRVALVVRFDDQFGSIWQVDDIDTIVKQLNEKLGWLIIETEQMGVEIAEIHLDYDCPVRKLERWSKILSQVTNSALTKQDVWITSLPVHIQNKRYSKWFSGIVKGHILQVFDTGYPVAKAAQLAEYAKKQKMDFRLGIGAFERKARSAKKGNVLTEHRAWFDSLELFSTDPHFQGIWIFPGGKTYLNLLSGGRF